MSLFELEPAEAKERPLGPRQGWALDRIDEHGEITAIELGVQLHLGRGCKACTVWPAACNYAERDGRALLNGLRRRGLLVRRRSGLWERPGTPRKPTVEGPGELPEGF